MVRGKPLRSLWEWKRARKPAQPLDCQAPLLLGVCGTALPVCLLCRWCSGMAEGLMHQDPFPASTENKVSQYLTLPRLNCHPVLSQQHCAFTLHSRACSGRKNTTSMGFSTAFIFLCYFEPTPSCLSPDIHELGHGVTTRGPEEIQGQMCSSGWGLARSWLQAQRTGLVPDVCNSVTPI